MREFIDIINEAIDYEKQGDKIIADLTASDSTVYTNLAKKMIRIDELKDEIDQLRSEVKSDTRQYIADLFDAEHIAFTRVAKTKSFIFTMSKNPKATETVQYSKVIAELEKQLTPELITVLEGLKKQYVTVTQKEPSLKVEPLKEGLMDNIKARFSKLLKIVSDWAARYDVKLNKLKSMMGV